MAVREVDYNQPRKRKLETFSRFMYDSDNRTFMRRTAPSWGKICLFYFVFYTCLALFFAALLGIFFATVDDNHPKWSGYDSMLKDNPGIGFQPMPDHLSTLIRFKSGAKSTYKIYTDFLHAFLLQYDNDAQQQGDRNNIVSCQGGRKDSDDETKVCQFTKEQLGRCIAENEFGYNKGEPCIMLKLNKVYGWRPSNMTIKVECKGQTPSDLENMGNLTYYPTNSFPAYYFPFLSQQNYMSPLVMVQFQRPELGILLMIECRAYDDNIRYNRQRRQGSVRFELLVD